MTQFAGTLTGQVIEEQLFINNQWVNYRTRGGAVQQDAFFSPTTQTPYTATPPSSIRWTSGAT